MFALLGSPLIASQSDDGFRAPSISDFFPSGVLFAGTPFQIDRIWVIRIVATLLLLTVFVVAARKAKVVPGRFQLAIEFLLGFVREQVVEEMLGKERGKQFVPMITTIFFAIVAFNLTAVIPGLNLAGSARIGFPLLLALWVLVTYFKVGIAKHGLGGYLSTSLFPPSVRKMPYLYLIVTPIEILQVFVVRPLSLAIRLTLNMVAGHITLVLTLLGTNYLITQASPALRPVGVLTLAGGLFVTLFEIFVAFLQAYIFTLLASAYINMALEEEH